MTTNLVERVHAALFRRMRRQLSSHVGGRGTPLHAELVKDFFVMIMNLSFNNIDAFVGFLQLIRYGRCRLLCVLVAKWVSCTYHFGTFATTPQEFHEIPRLPARLYCDP